MPTPKHNRVKAETTKDLQQTTQQGTSLQYRCKDGKEIKVVQVMRKGTKNKKLEMLNLTYENITEKLRSTVSETGKKYTNIHWQWEIQQDIAKLSTIVGVTLAEDCIKQ